MKAIILAAGEGSRLRPLTDERPKCLIELDGKKLLDWQIDVFKQCNIQDIIVVTGYMHHMVNRPFIKSYLNKNYKTTNMVHSLFCAENEFTTDIIISYADIIFNPDILMSLIKDENDISVIVDYDWEAYWRKRFDDPLMDAESLKINDKGKIVNIGQKVDSISKIDAQFIGLTKFSRIGLEKMVKAYNNALKVAKNGEKVWGQSMSVERAYMTDLLQGLIKEGHYLNAIKISGGWLEIDSMKDYELAKRFTTDGVIDRNKDLKIS